MEYYGVLIDVAAIDELMEFCNVELETIQETINNQLGYELNPNSPQQVSTALFTDLKLTTEYSKKNKTSYSVDVKALAKLKYHHPVCKDILEYRNIAKLKGKDIKPLPALVDSNNRIHTNYNTCAIVTGRWSSNSPNLQNIPNPYKSELGKRIRDLFIAPEGWSLLKIDYSQFELRLLAHLSQDCFLVHAFNEDADADIHTLITKLLFELDVYDKNNLYHKALRTLCKRMNFGIIYGMTEYRLMKESEADGNPMTFQRANEVINLWWSKLGGVSQWMNDTRISAVVKGYTEDVLKRRRYFDFDHPYLQSLRGTDFDNSLEWLDKRIKWLPSDTEKLRQAGNAPVQGSNASVIRAAMHTIYNNYMSGTYSLNECVPLLQVHDELVFQVRAEHIGYYYEHIKNIMEHAVKLCVPVRCDATICQSWGGGE